MGLRFSTTLVAAAAVVGIGFTPVIVERSLESAADIESQRTVVIAEASDRYPNHSARDWVTYADHVLVVTPESEQELPLPQEEVARGEGLIFRRLNLTVLKVVWSSKTAQQPAPQQFDWIAEGWLYKGSGPEARTETALADRPRLEMGHQYLMAVRWEPAHCGGEDSKVPAQWRGLGADSTVPFDEGVVGVGELEGSPRSLRETLAEVATHPELLSFEDQLAGHRIAEAQQTLASVEALRDVTRTTATPEC